MGKIKQMPESLANQIAAGEVVERPASVVKELVENAIDAGAKKIVVELVEAGIQLIRVTDNGQGMDQEDLELSVAAHATSKIYDLHDLFHIQSLGFRGEALASIASVSKMTLTSRTQDDQDMGHFLKIHGSKVVEIGHIGCPYGTSIVVEDLFYNTPARLKHLASIKTELKHSVAFIQQVSFAYPHIRFQLISDNQSIFTSYGTGDLQQTIAAVYQPQLARQLVSIQASDDDFLIRGYISPPQLTRTSKSYMHWLINGRVVQSYVLSQMLLKAYGRQLMIGRFPIAVIQIDLDPQLVDVNVHPTKQTVRLSKELELGQLLVRAVQDALGAVNPIPQALIEDLRQAVQIDPNDLFAQTLSNPGGAQVNHSGIEDASQETTSHPWTRLVVDIAKDNDKESQKNDLNEDLIEVGEDGSNDFNKGAQAQVDQEHSGQADLGLSYGEVNQQNNNNNNNQLLHETWTGPIQNKEETRETIIDTLSPIPQQTSLIDVDKLDFSALRYVGQIHGTYLIAESSQGFYLIDQHAAQERIRYEMLMNKQNTHYHQHHVLFPYIFEFSQAEVLDIEDLQDPLQALGIYLTEFGPRTYQMESYPDWMEQDQVEKFVRDVLELLREDPKISVQHLKEKTLIMQACRGAIKANYYLSDIEAKAIISAMADLHDPYHCPHGRPVFVSFNQKTIEKLFKRIQDSHQSGHQL